MARRQHRVLPKLNWICQKKRNATISSSMSILMRHFSSLLHTFSFCIVRQWHRMKCNFAQATRFFTHKQAYFFPWISRIWQKITPFPPVLGVSFCNAQGFLLDWDFLQSENFLHNSREFGREEGARKVALGTQWYFRKYIEVAEDFCLTKTTKYLKK